jgi:hypothetical protein
VKAEKLLPEVPASAVPARVVRHGGLAPTLDDVWLVGTLVFAFLVATLLAAEQTDYWWTVKLGDGLWATHQFPQADPLAFTSTRQPYIEQQWLAQLILSAVHAWGGLAAALLLRAAVLVLTAGLLYHAARRAGAVAAAAAAACSLAMLIVVGGAAIRPQLFAIPLFTLFLLGTTVWAARAWTLWALPLVMVAWVNLHGSFPLGLVLIGIALLAHGLGLLGSPDRSAASLRRLAADPLLRRLAALLTLCAVATLVNPYGLGILPWLVDFLRVQSGQTGLPLQATEWLPTSLATVHGTLFFLGVLALLIALLRAGPPGLGDLLRLLTFGVLALQAVRSTVWWALVAAPVLAWAVNESARGQGLQSAGIGSEHVDRGPASEWRAGASGAWLGGAVADQNADRVGIPALNGALIAGFIAVALLSLPWLRPQALLFAPDRWPIQAPDLPVAAADRLAALPATRLFNAMDWGGYLAWRLAPRQRIFVDGRFQLYPPEVYRDYFAIAAAEPGWAERLAAYDVDGLVLSRAGQPALVRALADAPIWVSVYCDAEAAIYLPRGQAPGPAVACEGE